MFQKLCLIALAIACTVTAQAAAEKPANHPKKGFAILRFRRTAGSVGYNTGHSAATSSDPNGNLPYEENWANPSNALSISSGFASTHVQAVNSAQYQRSYFLDLKDPQWTYPGVPNGATITGITVQARAKSDVAYSNVGGDIKATYMYFTPLDSQGINGATLDYHFPTAGSFSAFTLGGGSYLWPQTWARPWNYAKINDASFGFRVQVQYDDEQGQDANLREVDLDYLQIRVDYTTP
jgi:hypothetical protein